MNRNTKIIYKLSMKSYEFLDFFLQDRIKIVNKCKVYLDNYPLILDNMIIVLNNSAGRRIRRKNKTKYQYLNFYYDSSQLESFIERFLQKGDLYEFDIKRVDMKTYTFKAYINKILIDEEIFDFNDEDYGLILNEKYELSFFLMKGLWNFFINK